MEGSIVATAITSGMFVLVVPMPHYPALKSIRARNMTVPSLQTLMGPVHMSGLFEDGTLVLA